MTSVSLRAVAIGLIMAASAPVMAQTAPPAPPQEGMRAYDGKMRGARAFPTMSEAGRATMREAMRAGGDRKDDREQVKAARDRMLTVLEADRLDTNALKRAMDDERNVANASRERHQALMLTAMTKLSVADRKAFVADTRAMKSRMEARMKDWRGKRGRGGRDDMMPPPPPGM